MRYQLIKYKDKAPLIGKNVYLADNVVIAGDVTIGDNSNIWFNSVIRGDVAPVTIGKNTNIQDGTVIHTSRFNGPTHIGDNVTIGHKALIHACIINDNSFIGMGSVIMDKARVEEYGFLAAGSLLPPGKILTSKELWIGNPAKFSRLLDKKDLEFMEDNIDNYLQLAKEYMVSSDGLGL